jgi:hypothetical protein
MLEASGDLAFKISCKKPPGFIQVADQAADGTFVPFANQGGWFRQQITGKPIAGKCLSRHRQCETLQRKIGGAAALTLAVDFFGLSEKLPLDVYLFFKTFLRCATH